MVTLKQVKCEKCGYLWFPRVATPPIKCPNCQSRDWKESNGEK
jgi:predicted Zn-ribbon and HTH transcriptional regulator